MDLSDTEVTGTFHLNSVLKALEILKLTGTRTKIDLMVDSEYSECPFPKLTPWRPVGWPWTPQCPNS